MEKNKLSEKESLELITQMIQEENQGLITQVGRSVDSYLRSLMKLSDSLYYGAVKNADFVFTGEGKMDSQSVRGKVISGVARRAAAAGVAVIAVVGDAAPGSEQMLNSGVTAIFSNNRPALPFEKVKAHSGDNMHFVMKNIARLIKATRV